jgi:hypothetical protein
VYQSIAKKKDVVTQKKI